MKPVKATTDRAWFKLGKAKRVEGSWEITPVQSASTADLFTAAFANCYLHLPANGKKREPGDSVAFTLMDY